MKHTNPKLDLSIRAMLVAWALVMFGGESDNARKRVRDGVEAFRKRKWSEAARAFADADVLVPNDLTIKFNRGCAEARVQNREEAKRLLSVASSSLDRKVAMAAHYNLGTLEVLEAAQKFGAEPHRLKKSERAEGVERLSKAVKHFRDCLAIDPNNKDARKNIEIIRTWHANMRKMWKEQDEKKKNDQKKQEKTLPQVLAELDAAQFKAFDATSDLAEQRRSSDERKELQLAVAKIMPTVEEKLEAAFAQQLQGASEEQRPQVKQAKEALVSIYSQMNEAATEARGRFVEAQDQKALKHQTDVLNGANQLLEMVSQFPGAVQRSLALQTSLVKRLESQPTKPREEPMPISEGNSFLERQSRVAGLTRDLAKIAERFGASLEQQQQQSAGRGMPPEQLEGYKKAIERAGELSEELNVEIGRSMERLERLGGTEALPHAQRVLDILKEIAELLPKSDDQNQNGDQQDQQQDQENKNDEEQQDQKNESGDSQDDQKKQEDGEQKQEPEEKKKSAQEKRQIRSREEAEAMLRQVRDREQSLKDQKAALQAIRARSKKVKRDW